MSAWQIEYSTEYQPSPLSYWVHRHIDNEIWSDASLFEPPLPKPIIGKGYPRLRLTFANSDLWFSSPEEVSHFIAVLGQKNMPTSLQLSAKRDTKHGPNSHWLSRLPSKLKPWSKREKITKIAVKALIEYESLYR